MGNVCVDADVLSSISTGNSQGLKAWNEKNVRVFMSCQLLVADTIDNAKSNENDAKKYFYKQSAILGKQV